MSRATNRTSNISVTWNFKNPNISRNELINFIHLFREVPSYPREVSEYSRVLSRHCLAVSAVSRYLYCLAVFVRRHFSIFIFHLSLDARPKVSRKAFLSESASSRKFPERLFSPIQRTPESSPTTPPEISRFPFGTKVIKILDLSLYLPPTRPFAVSPTLSYSPKPVLHQPRHQTEPVPLVHQSPCTFILISPCLTTTLISPFITSYNYQVRFPDRSLRIVILPIPQNQSFTNHATRQNPLLSFINLLARLSSSHPVLLQYSSVQFITSYNYQVRFPDSSPCTVLLQSGNLELVAQGIARNLKRSAPM